MISALFRVLAGFALACLAVGLTKVAFVITPAELAALSGQVFSDRLGTFGMLTLLAATHSAIFAAPFALIAAVIGEWQSIRNPMYYAAAGVAIALGGFLAQYSSETGAAGSIANNYALKAFLTAGFVGGIAYWLVSGRVAGDNEVAREPVANPKIAVQPGAGAPPPVKPSSSVPASGPTFKVPEAKTGDGKIADGKPKNATAPAVPGLASKSS